MSTRNAAASVAPGRRPATATSDWRHRGGCVNRPAHWWDDDAAPELQRKARATCLSCPVFAECLKDAVGSEGGYDFGRAHTKAGLTGKQRDWLHRHSRKYGGYDAEEARLLALEAMVSGREVKEIAAREGDEGATVRLAARLLVGLIEDAADPPGEDAQTISTAGDKTLARLEEILLWRDEGASLDEIGKRIGVSRRTVTQTLKNCLGPDWTAVRNQALSAEEIADIALRRRRGVAWDAMDAEANLAPGTTFRRVCRWRRQTEARGEPIPKELAREQNRLTEEQVVRLRERAMAGVSDAEQAAELGLSRVQVTRIACGHNYKQYGGPTRPKKKGPGRPSEASRVLFNGATAGFAVAS